MEIKTKFKIGDRLCSASKEMYFKVRAIIPLFIEDTPFYEEIANVEQMLRG